jgi:hypothetical protein
VDPLAGTVQYHILEIVDPLGSSPSILIAQAATNTPVMSVFLFHYTPATRLLRVSWKHLNPVDLRDPNDPTTTLYKVYMMQTSATDIVDGHLLTATYSLTNSLTTISEATQTITNSVLITDFVTVADFTIPPLPSFNTEFTLKFEPLSITAPRPPQNPPMQVQQQPLDFSITIPTPVLSVCDYDPDSSSCQSCPSTPNPWTTSGCSETAVVQGCAGLTCPPFMTIDYASCSCHCESSTCIESTRGTMIYLEDPTEMPAILDRGGSFIRRTLRREIVSSLPLNVLPPPFANCQGRSTSCHLGYPAQPLPGFEPPVGIETFHLFPMTFRANTLTQLVGYISVRPFSSTIKTDAAYQTKLAARLAFLNTVFKNALVSGIGAVGERTVQQFTHVEGPTGLPTWPGTYAGDFIPLTLHSSQLSTTTTPPRIPGKLTTQCGTADGATWTYSCPPVSAAKTSPFWPQCPTGSTSATTLSLNIRCVDLIGKTYTQDTSWAQWCSQDKLFPTYPIASSINPCGDFTPPTISAFALATPTNIVSIGSPVTFTWTYVQTANPMYTVDFFVVLVARVSAFTLLGDGIYDDDDLASLSSSTILDTAPVSMNILQQNLSTGYSVLLGTFPASAGTASITIPYNLIFATVDAYFLIRITQESKLAPLTSNKITFQYTDACQDVVCSRDDPFSTCQPLSLVAECGCSKGSTYDVVTGVCVLDCAGKCESGTCGLAGCACSPGFTGQYCNIDQRCTAENLQYCSNRGAVLFDGQRCGSTCSCSNQWGLNTTSPIPNEAQCQACKLLDWSVSPCQQAGTNATRTPRRGCNRCYCRNGWTGDSCSERVMYGTFYFILPPTQTPPTSTDPKLFVIDDATRDVLIQDIALSMGIPAETIVIAQASTITLPSDPVPTPFSISSLHPTLTTLQAGTPVNSVTFAIKPTDATSLSELYDLWSNIQDSADTLPISQSETAPVVGTPALDKTPDAYDPECDSTTTSNCPKGTDPFAVDEDPLDLFPDLGSGGVTSAHVGLIVGVVVGVVVVILIFVLTIVLVRYCKKNQRACFRPRGKKGEQSNAGLELTMSESSTARFGAASPVTTTRSSAMSVYSSGTTNAVDLVEVELDEDEEELPKGWQKMKHVLDNKILFINAQELKSQEHHPLGKSTKRGKFF